MSFDIVIPLAYKDLDTFKYSIEYNKKNIIGYRNIYIVTPDPSLVSIPGCISLPETIFPFKKEDISAITGGLRVGWYFQQFIKLYVGKYIFGILPKYLVVDSDVFFLKPTTFLNEGGLPMYCIGKEYHAPYFDHMKQLHPSFHRAIENVSGIVHHMMFDTVMIDQLFKLVEDYHNTTEPFWKLFMKYVVPSEYKGSGGSEYEIYFNYMVLYHFSEIVVRDLNWSNQSSLNNSDDKDYVAIHLWID